MNKTLRNRIGRRIKSQRQALLLTQNELSRKSYITRGFLSDIERGARAVSVETLYGLCKALRLDPKELLT